MSGTIGGAERLEIESACMRLAADYSYFADARRFAEWEALFTEDGTLVVGADVREGRRAIRAFVGDGDPATATFHSNTNVRIDIVSPDEAHGTVAATVYVLPVKDGAVAAADLGPAIIGRYDDVYRRTQDGWRIHRRAFTPLMTRTAS